LTSKRCYRTIWAALWRRERTLEWTTRNLSKIQELKSQLAEAQTRVDSLSKENDELKASAEAAAKSKSKATKGKRKKKGKK
jgi:inosine/xanthosine triphosphate pyrophosphatase family protein